MVSHHYKCIFIHIPKSAGTSIKILLGKNEANTLFISAKTFLSEKQRRFDPPPPHLRAIDYVKYGYVTDEDFNSFFKFAFVRNPWDRIVSEYKYRRHSHKYDFKTFLFHHFPEASWSDDYCHILPQYDFLYDASGNLLVDFVGRYENLKSDFNKVCEKLKIPASNLPHENKSLSITRHFYNSPVEIAKNIRDLLSINVRKNNFPSYMDYYDDESKEFVAEMYKMDINILNYFFEGYNELKIPKNISIHEPK